MTEAARPDRPLAAYVAVTAAYWAFMLTDGALRMLVLLHFHILGFSPLQLAWLFLLYELAGIVTNLTGGWVAARAGLTRTLYAGLALQIAALLALAVLDPAWGIAASVVYVMAVQGLSGVAKDLAKMSAKSAVKLLAPEGGLFAWVAVLTGSKNAVKGLGFLLGAALLAVAGFVPAVLAMAAALGAILLAVLIAMPPGLPRGKRGVPFREVFSTDPRINRLAAARVFLFGARDVWFAVALPLYFYGVLSDGTAAQNRWAFFAIGSFMAIWTILYGAVQAAAPRLMRARGREGVLVAGAWGWAGALALVPLALAVSVWAVPSGPGLTGAVVAGLMAFGALFALNSSLHSWLVLAFSQGSRVTMDVGFYYMANAAGRLLGTLLSGLAYQAGGLALALAVSGAMLTTAAAISRGFRQGNL